MKMRFLQDFDPTLGLDFDHHSSSLAEAGSHEEGLEDDHIDSGVSDVSSETSGQRSPRPAEAPEESAVAADAFLPLSPSSFPLGPSEDPFFADIGTTLFLIKPLTLERSEIFWPNFFTLLLKQLL